MLCSTRYVCDHPGCRSSLELAHADDLKNPLPALEKRGWIQSSPKSGKPQLHLCNGHAPLVWKNGWTDVREMIERETAKALTVPDVGGEGG